MIDLLLEEGAVSDGNASQVKDLLNRREKRLPGNTGNIVHNPLIAAARDTDSAKLMAMLVDAGASLESRDKNGWDLFLYSFHEDQQIQDLQNQMIRLLVEQGADLYAEETMGETPLDFREDKDPEIYEILRPYYN